MTYNITRKTRGDFNSAVARVKEALKREGFGVLTEIDVAETLKTKIGRDFPALPHPRRLQPAFRLSGAERRAPYRRHAAVQRDRAALRQRRDRSVVDRSGDRDGDGRQRQADGRRSAGAPGARTGDRQSLGEPNGAEVDCRLRAGLRRAEMLEHETIGAVDLVAPQLRPVDRRQENRILAGSSRAHPLSRSRAAASRG